MTYTKQEKQKLKRVIAVFAERLKESDAFDLVWSDKVGYVLLDISTNYDYVDSARTHAGGHCAGCTPADRKRTFHRNSRPVGAR